VRLGDGLKLNVVADSPLALLVDVPIPPKTTRQVSKGIAGAPPNRKRNL